MTFTPTSLLFLSYLLGSLPFGLVLSWISGYGDIRKIGSGNIGATNVLRTGNKKLALATLLLDMLKGCAAVWLADMTLPDLAPLAGFCAFAGHIFPFWLDFKGGKGVATACGVLLALSWPVALMSFLVWIASAIILRISSLSALIATATSLVFIVIFERQDIMVVVFLMLILITVKHMPNILRLFKGTEPMIGQKASSSHDQKVA